MFLLLKSNQQFYVTNLLVGVLNQERRRMDMERERERES
jgi:hypothetical protein